MDRSQNLLNGAIEEHHALEYPCRGVGVAGQEGGVYVQVWASKTLNLRREAWRRVLCGRGLAL